MTKQAQLLITREDGETENIPCYIQLSGIHRKKGRSSWLGRRTFNGKQKGFSSSEPTQEKAWRDINAQCHDFTKDGKRSVLKRNTYTHLTQLVNVMLASSYEVSV